MDTKTYEPMSGIGKTGAALDQFGARQNALNAQLLRRISEQSEQIEALNSLLIDTRQELDALRRAHEALAGEHRALAEQMQTLRQQTERLRLTARLNTNAIERLSHPTGGDAD